MSGFPELFLIALFRVKTVNLTELATSSSAKQTGITTSDRNVFGILMNYH